ncbi:MAG: hypothetical protein PVI06_00440 [Desulfobacterales bacterium]|jgi:predicted homoserine dehydrogenase-like protein
MNLHALLRQRARNNNPVKVGIIGAGKFSTMFISQARFTPGMQIVGIAELDSQKARQACLRTGWPESSLSFEISTDAINDAARKKRTAITESAVELIAADLDVIVEITGDPEAGTAHAWYALETGKHVIMVNVEADCLLGPVLHKKAAAVDRVYSMAYGDQPAIIAELIDWARTAGLEVVCAGKGTRFQPEYHYSTPETVWQHYGFTEKQVATGDYNAKMFNSFLDGTKSAIEMCAVSNASGLIPQKKGLQFPPVGTGGLQDILKPSADGGILEHSGTVEVVACENRDGSPVKDDLRWGVYVVFKAPTAYVQRCFAEYGLQVDPSGKYSALYRPYHLIGLELGISVASAALRNEPTGSCEEFLADVAAVAKRDLQADEVLDGEGGFTVFGRLMPVEVSLQNSYLPMGLTANARLVRPVAKDATLTYDDVELDENLLSYSLRKTMEKETQEGMSS